MVRSEGGVFPPFENWRKCKCKCTYIVKEVGAASLVIETFSLAFGKFESGGCFREGEEKKGGGRG